MSMSSIGCSDPSKLFTHPHAILTLANFSSMDHGMFTRGAFTLSLLLTHLHPIVWLRFNPLYPLLSSNLLLSKIPLQFQDSINLVPLHEALNEPSWVELWVVQTRLARKMVGLRASCGSSSSLVYLSNWIRTSFSQAELWTTRKRFGSSAGLRGYSLNWRHHKMLEMLPELATMWSPSPTVTKHQIKETPFFNIIEFGMDAT